MENERRSMKTNEDLMVELKKRFKSRVWRLENLYYIIDVKGEVTLFKLNYAQKKFLANIHSRNVILKARQLGMSTFMAIFMLDACLWNDHVSCGIVDFRAPDAKKKLDKMKLAWTWLDKCLDADSAERKAIAPLMKELKLKVGRQTQAGEILPAKITAKEIGFSNGSSIYADTGFRGGTLQILHVSELAKISRKYPLNADEIKTGAFPAVPESGLIVVESTHEGGRMGHNYELCVQAMQNEALTYRKWQDFKFHFFPWWENPRYQINVPNDYELPTDLRSYFDALEGDYHIKTNLFQQAWYESQKKIYSHKTKEEYPSVPDEAFNAIDDNSIYAEQFTTLRMQGRIGSRFKVSSSYPIYCSWDLGVNDTTALTFIQVIGGEARVLWGYQNRKKAIPFYVEVQREFEETYGVKVRYNFIPHDGGRDDLMMKKGIEHMNEAGLKNIIQLKRTPALSASLGLVRIFLASTVWHERCGDDLDNGFPGLLTCMENYRYAPNGKPLHDLSSNMADSFRYFVEAAEAGHVDGYKLGVLDHEEQSDMYNFGGNGGEVFDFSY